MTVPMMPQLPPNGMSAPAGMETPSASGAANLDAMLAMLKSEFGASGYQPKYPRDYVKPKKPEQSAIWGRAMKIRADHTRLLNRFWHDLMWYRMLLVGMFPEDVEEQRNGFFKDQHQDPSLAMELETVSGFLSGLPYNPKIRVPHDERKSAARQVADALRFIRQEWEYEYNATGHGELSQEESKYLLLFGRIVSRTTPYLKNPELPLLHDLLDPATVFPVYEGRHLGPARVYHVYRAPITKILSAYNDVPYSQMVKIQNKYGHNLDEAEAQDAECVDYWDTWYRSVEIAGVENAGIPMLGVSEHKYGVTPFTIQLGPSGEPTGVKTPDMGALYDRSGDVVAYDQWTDDNVYKGLSYIHYMRVEHAQFEAIMSQIVTMLKLSANPPWNLEQSNDAASSEDKTDVTMRPGAITETVLGEQRLNPMTIGKPPLELNSLLNGIMQARSSTRMPDTFNGAIDRSNVSGTAVNNLTDAGMEKLGRWVKSKEGYHTQEARNMLPLLRNWALLAKYGGPSTETTPFLITRPRPMMGEEGTFELTPELIDAIGHRPRLTISLREARKQEWMGLITVGMQMYQLGIASKAMIAEWFGFDDFDRIQQEWIEDRGMEAAFSHPKFSEIFTIPAAIRESIKETQGDPALQEGLQQALEVWKQIVVLPAILEQQQGMQQMMQPQMPPGMPGGAPPPTGPPGMPPGGMPQNPPTAANVSYPVTGQGPGSVTGQQGGPPAGPNGEGPPPHMR